MTILSGNVTKAEGVDIIVEMDIEPIELFQVLTDEETERVIEEYNDLRADWNGEPVESVDEFPEFVYDEWREWIHFRHPEQLALEVLEARDQQYVHLTDTDGWGGTYHTVVEVDDE